MKAEWIIDYDFRTDSCYQRPGCPECQAPVGNLDGKTRCYSCGQEYELDDDMKAWNEARQTRATEIQICFMCGKKSMKTVLNRNPVTLDWQVSCGKCLKCGAEFIV